VGVVLVMMTLFATIFQMATGAMGVQKGNAENDQKVRLVMARLRNDLDGHDVGKDKNDPNRPHRTFLNVVPFLPDDSGLNNVSLTGRGGYFSISENNTADNTDDVLSLTIQMPSTASERFVGRAAIVFPQVGTGLYGFFAPPATTGPTPGSGYPPNAPAIVPTANPPAPNQAYWPNQPEFDDVLGNPTNSGASNYAEVSYFLRKGTLYRRALLVRQPASAAGATTYNPSDTTGGALDATTYSGGNRNFWTDFDYSAYYGPTGLQFHGTGTLTAATVPDSISAAFVGGISNPYMLGNPAMRFGFDCTSTVGVGSNYGQPREYVTSAGTTYFIGRFTHRETSNLAFGYPGNTTSGNPMSMTLGYNAATGTVTNFVPAKTPIDTRAGEDVLMTNVRSFDIKVWDPAAWVGPDLGWGFAGIDDDNNGTVDDVSEAGWPGSDDGDFRDIGHGGATGFYNATPMNVPVVMKYAGILPTTTSLAGLTAYTYPNTIYSNPASNLNRYDTWNPSLDFDNNTIHDCPPFCPYSYGLDGKPGKAGIDDDNNLTVDDISELGWPGSDDVPVPLSAIQIKIQFYDTTSKQLREVTLVQSLLAQ